VENGRQGQAIGGEIAAVYRARLAAREAAVTVLDRRHAHLAYVRLGLAASGVALLIWLGRPGLFWLFLPLMGFAAVAVWHARVLNALDGARRAVDFHRRGLARLDERWPGTGATGERFLTDTHPYASDFDLFGRGSLFELMSTPRTRGGEDALAGWLLSPAVPSEVRDRQQAVRELAPRLDFREDLYVLGPDVQAAVDTGALKAWATEPPRLSAVWPAYVSAALAILSTSLIGAWIAIGQPPSLLASALIVQMLWAARYRRAVQAVAKGVHRRSRELDMLATMLARLEQEPVDSPRLRAIKAAWTSNGRTPSQEIARLARVVDILTSRDNEIFRPLAALWLVGTQCAFAIDRWRARCGRQVPQWLDAVAEYEALSALAGYASEHPGDVFPEVVDQGAFFQAEALAHPLLPSGRSVANDVSLGDGGPRVWLVSGSNMSGKSTLLRAVGIAAVMAQAGAPVRARRLRMSALRPGATLRIQDSLQAGQSRFFAEITRLSLIVSMARAQSSHAGGAAVLFLLDEMLGGTNSHDRRIGAEGIIEGLVRLGGIGLVTTHDLALTEVVHRLGAAARNVHFEDRMDGGVMRFDFQLRDGIVQSSNALALMRSVGLDV
jgi:hypothetical protein